MSNLDQYLKVISESMQGKPVESVAFETESLVVNLSGGCIEAIADWELTDANGIICKACLDAGEARSSEVWRLVGRRVESCEITQGDQFAELSVIFDNSYKIVCFGNDDGLEDWTLNFGGGGMVVCNENRLADLTIFMPFDFSLE